MLAAFLLPLKVVILLGSEGIPRYYPSILAGLNRDTLIIGLSIASVVFYGLNLLGESLVKRAADRGAQQLLASTGKLLLFEDQDKIATMAYQQFTSALAGGLFVCLAMLLLLWLYPAIFLLLLAYAGLTGLLLGIALDQVTFGQPVEKKWLAWLPVATSAGFLLAFAGIVADFLVGSPPPLTPAIVALLLSRQLTTKVKTSIHSLARLLHQRPQIDALFFHRQVLLTEPAQEKTIWPLMLAQQRNDWVPRLLSTVLGADWATPLQIRWWPLQENNIAALLCEYEDRPALLIKLFERNRTHQALHEATLLSDPPSGLPAPVLLGTTQLAGFHCHILRLAAQSRPIEQPTAEHLQALRACLLKVSPPQALQERYCRSHPTLGQRLSERILMRMAVASDMSTELPLLKARQQLAAWRARVQSTALGFSVPVEPGSLVESADGEVLLLHWGKWALEPCGFGWPVATTDLPALHQSLDEAKVQRTDLATTSPAGLALVALSAALEHLWHAQDFGQALALLPAINAGLERLENAGSP
ncbi:hypothetical protein [Pseudomonas sp. N040]|uniref:hypothetical protein n=1 Tax=Pseudomonas sp. N040 TaxID=2785325 RepID=UPI0018A24BA0|nr:hypothetical protein [Pseudomonas sp. N040]MBF7731164.1 hypothetical protein [Pseudomonas sp. N040]